WSAGHWCVWCSASFSRLACTTRRRFRAQANGWIDAENPRLARPLHRLSKARNSIRLVLDRSHLWSSRIRGVREILAHPGKKPMGHRRRSEFGGCQSKTAAQNNNEPPCPRRFLTQPTEFEKSGVLQHPLASGYGGTIVTALVAMIGALLLTMLAGFANGRRIYARQL